MYIPDTTYWSVALPPTMATCCCHLPLSPTGTMCGNHSLAPPTVTTDCCSKCDHLQLLPPTYCCYHLLLPPTVTIYCHHLLPRIVANYCPPCTLLWAALRVPLPHHDLSCATGRHGAIQAQCTGRERPSTSDDGPQSRGGGRSSRRWHPQAGQIIFC